MKSKFMFCLLNIPTIALTNAERDLDEIAANEDKQVHIFNDNKQHQLTFVDDFDRFWDRELMSSIIEKPKLTLVPG